MLHTGDGHGAVFVNAVGAKGQFGAFFVPSAAPVHVHKVGAPLLGHSRGGLHALLLWGQSTQCVHSQTCADLRSGQRRDSQSEDDS